MREFYRSNNWLESVRGLSDKERRSALRRWLATSASEHERAEREVLLESLPTHWAKKSADVDSAKLRATVDALPELLDIAADDGDIKTLADEMALRCRSVLADLHMPKVHQLNHAKDLALAYGIRVDDDWDVEGLVARLSCQSWWLRCLRVAHAKAREAAAIDAGIVGGDGDLYCSDDTLERRGQQLRRNALLMADTKLRCVETGEVMVLADIANAGMANPNNRAAELITRTKGFEELALERQDDGAFITLTCPSRMHAKSKNKKGVVRPNKKYDGTKPDAANRYLNKCWARARAKLARDGISIYGLRTVEPHHDGCPHWHLVLWFEKGRGSEVLDVLRDYFIEDSADEKGASEHRVKWLGIDTEIKGGATAYVLKYITKNLGGIDGKEDTETPEMSSVASYKRVEAWATTWRIRQFQQIGGHGVGVWREARRVADVVIEGLEGFLKRVCDAVQKREAHQANFAEYIRAQGGLKVKPRESTVRVDQEKLITKGKYGQTLKYLTHGLIERYGFAKVKSERFQWVRA